MLKGEGWQPYSFRIYNSKTKKYGDWISYQFSPLLVMLSLIGNIKDYDKYRKEEPTSTIWDKASFGAINASRTFLDGTFLTSINSFLKAITETKVGQVGDDAIKSLFKTAKGFVLPALYTQSAREVQRAFDVPEKEVGTSLIAELVRDIPVARNTLNDKVNIWGEKSIADTDKFISKSEDSELVKTLTDKKAFISKPNIKTANIIDIENGKFRVMTNNEFFNYAEARGKYLKETLLSRLEDIKAMPADEAKKEVTSIVSDASKLAEAKVSLPEASYNQIKLEIDIKNIGDNQKAREKTLYKKAMESALQITPDFKKEIEDIKNDNISQISRYIVSKSDKEIAMGDIIKLMQLGKISEDKVSQVVAASSQLLKERSSQTTK
jgi:hypothetical protein